MKSWIKLVVFIFLGLQIFSGYAVTTPEVVKPCSSTASLRPEFCWIPVAGASYYAYSVKEYDKTTGQTTKIEKGTVSSTCIRITETLTDGAYYKFTVYAVYADNSKSNKCKFFFQAKEKYIYIMHVDLNSVWNANEGDSEAYLRYSDSEVLFLGYTTSNLSGTSNGWLATASVHLPNGAIITGFKTYFYDNTTSDSEFELIRTPGTDSLPPDGDQYVIATADTSTLSASDRTKKSSDLDSTKAVVDNDTYQYEMTTYLKREHCFLKAKITYID